MAKHKRSKFLVDGKLQGELALRVIYYWFFCLLSVLLMLACWTVFRGEARTSGELMGIIWTKAAPAMLGTVLVLPIVILDVLRMSNRFAGPVYRLRRAFQDVAAGRDSDPVILREHDHWQELANDFNRLLPRLNARTKPADTAKETPAN